MPQQFTLPKSERLYLRDSIRKLYAEGKGFVVFPYRVVYRFLPESDAQEARCAIMTVAPKKRFKHAVDRNKVKRLTREAYRIQKLPLLARLEEAHLKLAVAFLYMDSHFLTFAETEQRLHRCIEHLEHLIPEHSGH